MRITLLRRRQFWQKMHVHLNIFYLRCTPGIIHVDRFVRKTPKIIILFKYNSFFQPLNLVTVLLYEEILVSTSFWRQLQ